MEPQITEEFSSSTARIYDWRCHPSGSTPGPERLIPEHAIVFPRSGVFLLHGQARTLVVDPNTVAFLHRGETCRLSHPASVGDCSTVLVVSPEALHNVGREHDPSIDERPLYPFLGDSCTCEPSDSLRFRRMLDDLPLLAGRDAMAFEEALLHLVHAVLGLERRRREAPRSRPADVTDRRHAEMIAHAKVMMSARLGERLSLGDVAAEVDCSPFHLARLFKRHTGRSLHQYLQRLRLRAALERLADTKDSLTTIALEAGFSSHSHFTDSFRREFGAAPSSVRRSTPRESQALARLAAASEQESGSRVQDRRLASGA